VAVSKKTTIYLQLRHYILPFKNYQVDFERLMIFRARKKGKKMESGYGFEKLGLSEFVKRAISLHQPRYLGHQVCPPAPVAALAGLVSELLNNGMAVYEMGPSATALERWIIDRTATLFGMPKGAGFLTSGGTLGMTTALLAARARQIRDAAEFGTERSPNGRLWPLAKPTTAQRALRT